MNSKNLLFPENLEPKTIGFDPMFFSNFFIGMKVVQMKGIKSEESVMLVYDMCDFLCGHFYWGKKYDCQQISKLIKDFAPNKLSELEDFSKKNSDQIIYFKMEENQYLWIYQNAIKKIEP